MSRSSLPWYRAYWTLVMDEDYTQLTISEQGVYHNLRDWAAGQKPRGTFQVGNLDSLARHVSCGDVDLLRSVLTTLTTKWVGEDGTPHVTVEGGRGRFTTWEKWQRPPSEEPEAVAERQRRYKESNNGNKTVIERPITQQVEREVEVRNRTSSNSGGGVYKPVREVAAASTNGKTPPPPIELPEPQAKELEQVRDILSEDAPTANEMRAVAAAFEQCPQTDPVAVAVDHAVFVDQAVASGKPPPASRFLGWASDMRRKRDWKDYQRGAGRPPPDTEFWEPPPEELARIAERDRLMQEHGRARGHG